MAACGRAGSSRVRELAEVLDGEDVPVSMWPFPCAGEQRVLRQPRGVGPWRALAAAL